MRLVSFIALFLAFGATAASALAPDAHGYAGKGQLVVQTTLGGATTLTIDGDIAFEERGSQLRLDVLSLAVPGTDPTISALGIQFFSPGGFTVVFDRTTSTYTVWSNAKRTYYVSIAPAHRSASPVPASAAAISAAGDLFSAFSFARGLKDDTAFNLSLTLSGHSIVNGQPATGLNYQYFKKTSAGEFSDIHGNFELADDLDAIPIALTASVKSNTIPPSSLRLDLTTFERVTPEDSDFAVPSGYSATSNLFDVIGKVLSR